MSRVKATKTTTSTRAVPLQGLALDALDAAPRTSGSALVFPAPHGGHFDLDNFRNRHWKPALEAAAITPRRRVYDLRHSFATFALRAGLSTFELSRYMGTSLTMIDHVAPDANHHTLEVLDAHVDARGRRMDVASPDRQPFGAAETTH